VSPGWASEAPPGAAPLAWPAVLPLAGGLKHLHDLARSLTEVTGRNARVRAVLTVPTMRLAPALAALGALQVRRGCGSCQHRQLDAGSIASGYLSGRFCDSRVLSHAPGGLLDLGGLRLQAAHHDGLHRLPAGFPERRPSSVPPDVLADLAGHLGQAKEAAIRQHAAFYAHPVVVAGEAPALARDVDTLVAAAPGAGLAGRLRARHGLEQWFRSPVITVSVLPGPHEPPWVDELRPRLVVVAGSAAWSASWRGHWSVVPHLLLLSRRAPASAELAETLAVAGWPRAGAAELGVDPGLLVPADGLETAVWREPEPAADPVDDDDEDTW
jgi:hypothetical protein